MTEQKAKQSYSEPDYAKGRDKHKVPFYQVNIEHKIPPETKELLENYSHIPRDRQSEHVHRIRDQAFDIRAYPCTGLGSFLVPQLCRQPVYPEILQRAKDGANVMDVGTFIGHDLRRLVFDGAPSDNLIGVDIVSHFDVGYDFFNDRESFKGRFIEADFLSTTAPELLAWRSKVDVVIISQVLHQWNWENQIRAAQTLSTFTKPGSIIVGNQIGNPQSQEICMKAVPEAVWRHNPESIAKLWEEVGAATGTRWETQSALRSFSEMGFDPNDSLWMEPGVCLMEFVAKRIA